MAETGEAGAQGAARTYRLSEVSKQLGISMPTLRRYAREHRDKLKPQGRGRAQRFPEASLPVFEQLKREGLSKRGRPRKDAAGGGRRAASKRREARRGRPAAAARRGRGRRAAASTDGLLTLTEVGKQSGISYPTLQRYVREHLGELRHEGSGRKRRFHPESVEVFKRLRAESRRGRKPAAEKAGRRGRGAASARPDAALSRRLQQLERAHAALERQLATVIKRLEKPLRITVQR